jgi:hypothetical protein
MSTSLKPQAANHLYGSFTRDRECLWSTPKLGRQGQMRLMKTASSTGQKCSGEESKENQNQLSASNAASSECDNTAGKDCQFMIDLGYGH